MTEPKWSWKEWWRELRLTIAHQSRAYTEKPKGNQATVVTDSNNLPLVPDGPAPASPVNPVPNQGHIYEVMYIEYNYIYPLNTKSYSVEGAKQVAQKHSDKPIVWEDLSDDTYGGTTSKPYPKFLISKVEVVP